MQKLIKNILAFLCSVQENYQKEAAGLTAQGSPDQGVGMHPSVEQVQLSIQVCHSHLDHGMALLPSCSVLSL